MLFHEDILQEAYAHLEYREGDFLMSERLTKEIVFLPMYPNLTDQQQAVVYEAVKQILDDRISSKSKVPALLAR